MGPYMRKHTKLTLIVSSVVVCLLIIAVRHQRQLIYDGERKRLDQLVWYLKWCIAENKGRFPSSEQQLIQQRLLRKEPNPHRPGEYIYRIYRGKNDKEGLPFMLFERFNIRYGANLEDFKIIDGYPCNKQTRQDILLIEGVYPELRATYIVASRELCQHMLWLQKAYHDRDENNEPDHETATASDRTVP